ETQIDGYSAALFFLQSVGIDPSKSLDQRGFPMIDMAGSANNDGLHRSSVYSAIRPHAGHQHSNHVGQPPSAVWSSDARQHAFVLHQQLSFCSPGQSRAAAPTQPNCWLYFDFLCVLALEVLCDLCG